MTANAAEFFTLAEVNRLKIIQNVVDRRLTTQIAAQRLDISCQLYQVRACENFGDLIVMLN
ncbi:hypothetical protein NNQ28_16890 [Cronobacter dublinensis]|nr:hypothetical protein [Cronobacter dublinensis]ELY2738777.1 hypothetical protein [Cronobacter dublinensis]NCH73403.1 hypothetical protein [Cronobacter dublinensis]WNY85001.1 hypothetical protein NNQ28_16890 [Cronobacter dublinensis]